MTAKTGNDKRHAVTGLIGHVAAFWRSSPVARMVAPILCLCYDVMMLTRIVFTHGGGDSAAMKLLEHQWGIPSLAILCAYLLWRCCSVSECRSLFCVPYADCIYALA